MEQLSFTYNEAEVYASGTKAAAEKPVAVQAHERKRQSGNVLDVVPEGLSLIHISLFYSHLKASGVPDDHIVKLAFDSADDLLMIGDVYKRQVLL